MPAVARLSGSLGRSGGACQADAERPDADHLPAIALPLRRAVDIRFSYLRRPQPPSGVISGGTPMASVEVQNVRKSFGSVEVIHGVSVDIADGEFVILVGPSGCGKSTLLRMIAGLEMITAGDIKIGGRVVNDVPPKERDIAMVFQNYALYPAHDGRREHGLLAEAEEGSESGDRRQRVGRAAEILGLDAASRPLPAAALRRPAPARRHGPRHRPRPAGLPVRRAAVQPRRQAARRRCAPRSRNCISG